MAHQLPLLRSLGGRHNRVQNAEIPAVMSCSTCEVTWRDTPGAPCWFCGETGELANPARIVLD